MGRWFSSALDSRARGTRAREARACPQRRTGPATGEFSVLGERKASAAIASAVFDATCRSAIPPPPRRWRSAGHYPVMSGKRVFKHAVTKMPTAIMEGMVTNQLKLTDIAGCDRSCRRAISAAAIAHAGAHLHGCDRSCARCHQDGLSACACRGADGTSRTEISGPPRL